MYQAYSDFIHCHSVNCFNFVLQCSVLTECNAAIHDPTGTDQLPLAEVEEVTKEVCSDWYSLAVELEISHRFRKVGVVTD